MRQEPELELPWAEEGRHFHQSSSKAAAGRVVCRRSQASGRSLPAVGGRRQTLGIGPVADRSPAAAHRTGPFQAASDRPAARGAY